LWAILLIFIHCMLYSYGSYAWRLLGMQLHLYKELEGRKPNEMVQFQMTYSFISVLFFGITRHIYNYVKLKQASQQLKIEKQAAELNYLRSQTNPHFLFNTLNNIYSLARDKSDLAPESILKLSKILRFMLYETSASHITVEQEIKVISDYIALEKLRYDETLRVDFNCDVDDMRQPLPPLLLMPLVDNAFKHGVSETRDQPFINIHLSVNKSQLVFVVKNSADESRVDKDIKENIGLSNVRRQLELLYTEWSLDAGQSGAVFTARLSINLAGNGKN
jgi:two-component system, LytTR family, sensor kinase